MPPKSKKAPSGFSLIELTVAMTVMLVMLGIVSTLLYRAMGVRARETQTADALSASQSALNVISREVSNAGFGLHDPATDRGVNGIVLDESDKNRIRFRANLTNTSDYSASMDPGATDDPGEDVTYFHDAATKSIVRYDPNGSPQTAVVVNRISSVTFKYWDYTGAGTMTSSDTPSADTCRIEITVEVNLDPVAGQPDNRKVQFKSQINLRNAEYMLRQY